MNRALVGGIVAACGLSFVLAFGGTAEAKAPPKGKVVIKGCQKKKPPVTFDHSIHVKVTKNKCETCHHPVKGKAPEHNNCSKCHAQQQGSKLGTCADMSPKKNPYHVRCVTCHKQSGKAEAPTKCKQCHK